MRWLLLLFPALVVLLQDPASHDVLAFKSLLVFGGAILLALSGRAWRWSDLSLPLLLFLGVRGGILLVDPGQGVPVRAFLVLVGLFLLHHADFGNGTREWCRRRALTVLPALLLVVALFALGQRFLGAAGSEVGSFLANRNVAAAGIALLLPFALQTRWRWGLLALALAAVVATRTKSGLLACGATLLLYLVWDRRGLRRLAAFGLPLLLLAGLFVGARVADVGAVDARAAYAKAALSLGASSPWRGHGAEGFFREYPPIRSLEEHAIESGRRVANPHNDFLDSFAEGGVPALLVHLFLLLVVARVAARDRAVGSALFGFAMMSLVDSPLRDPTLLCLLFLLLRIVSEGRSFPARSRVLLALPLLALLLWGGRPLLDHWRAERAFLAYFHAGDASRVDRALELEPDLPIALLSRGTEVDLRRLIERDPHNAAARFRLGGLLEAEAADGGEAWYRDILSRHDPHQARTRVRLAELVMARAPAEAKQLLEHAVVADRNQYRSWLLLARLVDADGDRERAGKLLAQAAQVALDDEGKAAVARFRADSGR